MESARLLIRRMEKGDEAAFVSGIADRALRIAYGFPPDMEDQMSSKIFERFSGLESSYSLIEKGTGKMIGFLLEVDPELPEDLRKGLPGTGKTLAYAVFPPYQRMGYMLETLQALIPELFRKAEYIHCGHFEENIPSRELLRKLGFREHARHQVRDRLIIDEILRRKA
jgi:RimJ/RimL family protein N-acetyltransferase